MSDNVIDMFPKNDFKAVTDMASGMITGGVIIGYDEDGSMVALAGGDIGESGNIISPAEILVMIEQFKLALIMGDYNE